MASRPFGPRNTTHLLSFPCRVLDRSSGYRVFRPVTPGTAPGPGMQGSDSSGATPYPSRITSWFGGGQHHLYRHRLRFPRVRPVSRFSPPLASSLPPAELKARFHGWTRLAWIDPASTGRECAGFLPFGMSPPFIRARPHIQKLGAASCSFGFPAYPSRWPDAPVARTPRARRARRQHSELLKSLGVSKLQNAKTPAVRSGHQPGFLGILGRCLVQFR